VSDLPDRSAGYEITASDADPPWVDLTPAERAAVDLDRVRAAFARHSAPPRPEWPRELRPSAVLILLFERGDSTRLLLIKRSTRFGSHRGDVAFPGGVLDAGETPREAALREAWEELGIAPELVEVVGQLSDFPALHTGFRITPVVGIAHDVPTWTPNADEVEAVFDVAIADALEPARYREQMWRRRDGVSSAVAFFDLTGGVVWGATATILVELLSVVTTN
jgi:8-oxo-dGTP pyrophosphatase MutT (NUDIX family)